MSAFGGKADAFQGVAEGLLIAKSGSSVSPGQHETFSYQIFAEGVHFLLRRHLFMVVSDWNLSGELGKND